MNWQDFKIIEFYQQQQMRKAEEERKAQEAQQDNWQPRRRFWNGR